MKLCLSFRKIVSVIATFATLFNSLAAPMAVLAQEATPTPTPTATQEPTISPEATVSPTDTSAPTEVASPTPEVVIEPTPTDSATLIASSTAQPETQSTTSENTQSQAPPSESPTVSPSATPNVPTEHGTLSQTLIENVDLTGVTGLEGSISTDKPDYSPSSLVLITGSGFIANKTYTINIVSTDEPPVNFTDQVKADGSGNISYAYQLDGNYRPNYTVYVKTGEIINAVVTFTDGNISVNFDQCANDDNPTPAGQCNWIGSILQGNNSTYFEGMSVPQRILYQGITTPGAHTISFAYSYTKGGTHAYDFLTSLNQGNGGFSPGITNLDKCDGLSGGDATACNALVGTTATNVSIPNDPFDSKDSPPGVGTGTTQTQKENWYQGQYGSREISVHSSNAFSGGLISLSHTVGADADTGDSDVNVTLNFNLAGCSAASPCDLLIFFSGHLAVTGSINNNGADWGQPLGSSNINGGPYHIKGLKFDGDGGSLDNQIAGADIILPGTIVINKNTTGADGTFNFSSTGGSTVPSSFSITTSGNSGSQTFNNVLAGNYTVAEVSPGGGFSFSNLVCSDPTTNTTVNLNTRTASINVAPGETVSCTFTNTLQQAHLNVVKHVINDNGGTAVASDFTLDSGGTNDTPDDFAGAESPGTDVTLDAGSYSVTESGPSGYTASYSADCSGTIAAGETKTCTVTNDDNAPSLILNKIVINDNGGTQPESAWTLTATGNQQTPVVLSGPGASGSTDVVSNATFKAGTYTLTESGPAGYSASSWSCTGTGTLNGNQITLGLGQSAVCSITNDDIAPTLKLVKSVASGSASPASWNLTATGTGGFTDAGNSSIFHPVLANQLYTLSESVLSGYSQSGNWECDNTTVSNGDEITLGINQNVTCTVTNTRDTGTITVDKVTDPSADLTDFDFSVLSSGAGVNESFTLADQDPVWTMTLPTGAYTVSEGTLPSGWAQTNLVCTSNQGEISTGPTSPNALFNLDSGENVFCTYTNTKYGSISGFKFEEGSINPLTGWLITLFLNGNYYDEQYTTVSGYSFTNLLPGEYSLSEGLEPGWTPVSSPSPISLGAGDESPDNNFVNFHNISITACKKVDTDGDLSTTDDQSNKFGWTVSLNNGQSTDIRTTGDNGCYTWSDLGPGNYSVSEDVPAGWTALTPTSHNFGAAVSGRNLSFTFVNFNLGQISGKKYNDLNGNGEDDEGEPGIAGWTIYIDANSNGIFDGGEVSTTTGANGSYLFSNLGPGTYTIREVQQTGWEQTDPTGADSTLGGQNNGSYVVVMTSNGNKTQRNFGNQVRGSIRIIKDAVPNDGQNFEFTSQQFATFYLDDDANDTLPNQTTFSDLGNNTYTITESPVTGWKLTDISCNRGSRIDLDTKTAYLTIDEPGESIVCTFTNSRLPTLTLHKTVVKDDGGTATLADFQGKIDGNDVPWDQAQTLDPGDYTASESGLISYLASSWGTDCAANGSVSLAYGDNKTCSITNDDIAPTLTVIKDVINNNGGVATISDFGITLDASPLSFGAGSVNGDTTTYTANPNVLANHSYTLAELDVAGYTEGTWSCTDDISQSSVSHPVTLTEGQAVTCTITNDDQAGQIKIIKNTLGGNGIFNFTVSGPTPSTPSIQTSGNTGNTGFVNVDAGAYSITESAKAGWELTGSSCTAGSPNSITVPNGGSVTCTFTNAKYGYMQGRKYSDTNMDGRLENTETFLDGWTIRLYDSEWQPIASQITGNNGLLQGQYRFGNLLPGTYYACEVLQNDYQQTGPIFGNHAVDYNNNQVNNSVAVTNGSGATDEAPICWQSNINGDEFGWLGFGNVQKGRIIVKKVTNVESEDEFGFRSNFYEGNFYLTSGGEFENNLTPGTYSVSELDSKEWRMTSATCSDQSPVNAISLQPGETITCTFNNTKLDPKISIAKSNNSGSGINAGSNVTYTLTVSNNGNVDFSDVLVTDFLPGGFTYVDGSTSGATFINTVGSKLSWNISSLPADSSVTIAYQVTTNSSLTDGDYKNFATCLATYNEESTVRCDQVNSTVKIGHGLNYGGNLQGQVLGISTELPATGSSTALLILSLGLIGSGFVLNNYNKRKGGNPTSLKLRGARHAKK